MLLIAMMMKNSTGWVTLAGDVLAILESSLRRLVGNRNERVETRVHAVQAIRRVRRLTGEPLMFERLRAVNLCFGRESRRPSIKSFATSLMPSHASVSKSKSHSMICSYSSSSSSSSTAT